MADVKITVNGVTYTANAGVNLGDFLAAYRLRGEPRLGGRPCGGRGLCGGCRVTASGALSEPSKAERAWLSDEELACGVRLACRVTVLGDCMVTFDESGADMQILVDGVMPEVELLPAFSHYGVAIDIGTTTLVARLYDTAGRPFAEKSVRNPQSAWGADVVSRMEAAMRGEAEKLTAATVQVVDDLLKGLTIAAGVREDRIDGVVVSGNTVMLHLLTGTPVEPLARAPFKVTRLFGETLSAAELGLSVVLPETPVYLPPCISAYVGADAVSALLVADLREGDILTDIGTNGEMVLRRGTELLCCSVAAGPAFEGVGISCGMSGQNGAIDRVTLQSRTLVPRVIGNAAPRGLCGSGLVDAVACLLDTFRLDSTGLLRSDPTVIVPPVALMQADIRAVQMAKSAILSGIETLLHIAGQPVENVPRLFVAGGFGSYLDAANAGRIGLLPATLVPRVQVLGNAALAGAAMLLLDRRTRETAADYAARATVVELSTNPVFAEKYMQNMEFKG